MSPVKPPSLLIPTEICPGQRRLRDRTSGDHLLANLDGSFDCHSTISSCLSTRVEVKPKRFTRLPTRNLISLTIGPQSPGTILSQSCGPSLIQEQTPSLGRTKQG